MNLLRATQPPGNTARVRRGHAIPWADDNVRMIATDGILVHEPPANLEIGDGLGRWEAKQVRNVLAIQPGLYFFRTNDGEEHIRSRGFGRADLSFEQAAAKLSRDVQPTLRAVATGTIQVMTRRFQGLGTTVARKRWKTFCHWVDEKRKIRINPWPRRGGLVLKRGRVETYAIPEVEGKRLKGPNSVTLRNYQAERDAEREPTEGGSLW